MSYLFSDTFTIISSFPKIAGCTPSEGYLKSLPPVVGVSSSSLNILRNDVPNVWTLTCAFGGATRIGGTTPVVEMALFLLTTVTHIHKKRVIALSAMRAVVMKICLLKIIDSLGIQETRLLAAEFPPGVTGGRGGGGWCILYCQTKMR